MTSAWGVEHGVVSKAAFKAFFPAPPGVGKLPRSKMLMHSSPSGGLHTASTLRGKPISSLSVEHGTNTIGTATTSPGFRRRGAASNLLASAEKQRGAKIAHSTNRTALGDAFARGTDKKRGFKPPTSTREGELKGAKKPMGVTTMRQGSRRVSVASQTGRTGIERGKKKIPFSSRPAWGAVDNGDWF